MISTSTRMTKNKQRTSDVCSMFHLVAHLALIPLSFTLGTRGNSLAKGRRDEHDVQSELRVGCI